MSRQPPPPVPQQSSARGPPRSAQAGIERLGRKSLAHAAIRRRLAALRPGAENPPESSATEASAISRAAAQFPGRQGTVGMMG